MHLTRGPEGTRFVHHGDFSGEVRFEAYTPENKLVEVRVPFADLQSLVAEKVRRERIEKLEAADDLDLLA
jgi:hypothetical protein